MPLVEIIAGEQTSDATLARAFDVARQMQQDPDRGQRQPRLLHQPGDRHVHQRGRRDARRGHRPATIEQAAVAGRLPGAGAAADRRAHPHAAAQDPRRGPGGGRGRRRRLRPAPGRGRDRPAGRASSAAGQQRRRRVLRLRRRQAHAALAGPARALRARRTTTSTCASWPSGCCSSRRSRPQRCLDEGVLTSVRRREHRLDLRHRLPAVDGGVVQYSTATRAAWPASWPAPTSWPTRYGERFRVPASLRRAA